jgi:hypothetical protein
MSTIEKVLMGIVGVAMVTTVILPGRQTPAVLNAFGSVFNGALRASMGR